jgi:hypothetical protein
MIIFTKKSNKNLYKRLTPKKKKKDDTTETATISMKFFQFRKIQKINQNNTKPEILILLIFWVKKINKKYFLHWKKTNK